MCMKLAVISKQTMQHLLKSLELKLIKLHLWYAKTELTNKCLMIKILMDVVVYLGDIRCIYKKRTWPVYWRTTIKNVSICQYMVLNEKEGTEKTTFIHVMKSVCFVYLEEKYRSIAEIGAAQWHGD